MLNNTFFCRLLKDYAIGALVERAIKPLIVLYDVAQHILRLASWLLLLTCLWLVGLQLCNQSAALLYAQSPAADLAVSVAASADPVNNAQTVSYTILVQNNGTDDAHTVIITDSLPVPYLRYSGCTVSSDGACKLSGDQVVARFPVLAANSSHTIQVEALSASVLLSGTEVTNDVSVQSDTFDPNLQNNRASAVTTLWVPFDTTVSQSHSPEPVLAGGTAVFTIQAKNLGPNPVYRTLEATFDNLAPLTLPDSQSLSPTVADLYPSVINVANVVDSVVNVAVTLHHLSHSQASDLDILLVGPSGDSVTLMSDVGGSAALNDVTLDFTDSAPLLPSSGSIGSGVYRPTNYANESGDIVDTYPAPGLGGLSDRRPLLGRFNNKLADGAWKLYVVDDHAGYGGTLLGGWSLTLTSAHMTLPLTLTAQLPEGFTITQTSTTGWGRNIDNNLVTFTRQSFAKNASSTFVITATASSNPGTYTTDVFFNVPNDPNPQDNLSIATTTVLTTHDLIASEAVTPNIVVAGEPLTYTLQITNVGPSQAWNPAIVSQFPANMLINSVMASQGDCVQNNSQITCNPGLIASQVLENVVTIQVLAFASTQPARVASSVTVASDYDPQPGNNSALIFVDIVTATPQPTDPATATLIPSQTPTDTPTAVATPPPTGSPSATATKTPTDSPRNTPTTPPTYTTTPTPTPTHTSTPFNTSTPTFTATPTPTLRPTVSITPSANQESLYLPLLSY